MTNPGPTRGWKVRRDKARAKHEITDDRAAIRAERQRMADEKLAADLAAAAEYAKTQERARCSCPVCDAGPVDLELAARIVTALAKLPAHIPTDPNVITALHAVVGGREIPRSTIYGEAHKGLHVPHRMYAPAPVEYADTITANSPEEVAAAVVEAMTKREPATVNPKAEPVIPSRRRPSIAELAVRGDADDQGD